MEFKDKLRKLRTQKGLSQQALGDAIHVSRSAVAKWENGLGYPSQDCFEALTAFFQVEERYFQTEEPEAVIVTKNRNIQILKTALSLIIAIAAIASAFLFFRWMGTVPEYDTEGLSRQAAEYLGYEELEIVELTKRGDYLAALCRDPNGNWCMCVFNRDDLFADRWTAGGGKSSIDRGEIGSWNYGSPKREAVLIICGGDLAEDVKWYSFENSGVEYTCRVEEGTVLDIYIILDRANINGNPIPLDENKEPIK